MYGQPLYRLLDGKHRDTLKAYASQLQNGWDIGRKTARTPADYARQEEIAVEKGFKAVKYNFLTFREDEGRYPRTEQTAYLDPEYLDLAEARSQHVREAGRF